jgi:hypothetical protein
VRDSCVHCNKHSISIKYCEIPEYLRNGKLLKSDSKPRSRLVSHKESTRLWSEGFQWVEGIRVQCFSADFMSNITSTLYKKQTPWPLVRKRTIPTEGRHLKVKFSANVCG